MEAALQAAVEKTLSDMAFVDVMEPEAIPDDVHCGQVLHISFMQPMAGEIILSLPSPCKRMIVENIFGTDWSELQSSEIDDCLLELLNVLAGNFLYEYCGEECEHDLSLPVLMFDAKELRRELDFTDTYYDAEGIIFKVSLSVIKENGESKQHG